MNSPKRTLDWNEIRKRLRGVVKYSKGALKTARYDTSDVVQNSVLQMLEKERAADNGTFEFNASYLKKVGYGNAARMRRHHTAKCRAPQREKVYRESVDHQSVDPKEIAESKENLVRLLVVMDELAPELRAVFRLRYLEQMTFREISEDLDVHIDTARRRAKLARQVLKAELGRE